jgi:hypothetical protein
VENPALCMGCMKNRGGARVCPHCGFDEANPPSVGFQLPLRTLLDEQYVVGRALGAGGFAITYLAWDQRLARRVAIKEYMPSGLASRSGQTSQLVPHTGVSEISEIRRDVGAGGLAALSGAISPACAGLRKR